MKYDKEKLNKLLECNSWLNIETIRHYYKNGILSAKTALMMYFISSLRNDYRFYKSHKNIAKDLNMNVTTCSDKIFELQKDGFIHRVGGKGKRGRSWVLGSIGEVPNPGETPIPNPGETPISNPGETPTLGETPTPGETPISNPGEVPISNPGETPISNPGEVPISHKRQVIETNIERQSPERSSETKTTEGGGLDSKDSNINNELLSVFEREESNNQIHAAPPEKPEVLEEAIQTVEHFEKWILGMEINTPEELVEAYETILKRIRVRTPKRVESDLVTARKVFNTPKAKPKNLLKAYIVQNFINKSISCKNELTILKRTEKPYFRFFGDWVEQLYKKKLEKENNNIQQQKIKNNITTQEKIDEEEIKKMFLLEKAKKENKQKRRLENIKNYNFKTENI